MENKYEKIAKKHLDITEDCSEVNREIINLYWKLQDINLINTPKWIKKEFDITQSQLTKIVTTYATFSFYVLCDNCISYEFHKVKSQSRYSRIANSNKFKCNNCEEQELEQLNLEKEKKRDEFIQKFNNAIENKNWKNLSAFEKVLLSHSLEMNFHQLKKHYGSKLGQSQFYVFIKALEKIEAQNLLFLERNSWNNYIIDHQYLRELLEYKDEITFIEDNTESSVIFDNETNEIKFKLTVNDKQNHPDSPLYAGTVIFKEKIVIEPNVEYAFGQWKRANDHLYLTMIPIENLEKLPQQKRISQHPISIQKGITDFLNNMGKNL